MDTSEDPLPRYKEENPFGYTNLELAQRKKALLDMEKDYPNVPYAWLEMLYDWHAHTPNEEVKEIINTGKWEYPSSRVPVIDKSKEITEK